MTIQAKIDAPVLRARHMAHYVAERAARHACTTMERDDVLALADAALVEAWQHFVPERGIKFTTYAYPWVKGAIVRAADRLNRRSAWEQGLVADPIARRGPWEAALARGALALIPRADRRLVWAHLVCDRPFEGLVRGCSATATRRRFHRALAVAQSAS
jgi:hypothetical protein